jgi:hypothetical protein
MRPGASRLPTTAAGHTRAIVGFGRRVPYVGVPCTRLRSSCSWVTTTTTIHGGMVVATSPGFRSRRTRSIVPRITRAIATCVVPVEQARYAHVVGDGAPVAPTEQSVIIRRRDAAPVSRPPEAVQNRPVVWKNTPPARPATFASHEDQLKSNGNTPVAPLPISETRGARRTEATRPMPHTDAPAVVNGTQNNEAAHTVAPNTTGRRVPNVRPNVNVQRYPAAQAQQDENVSPKPAPTGNANSNARRNRNEQPDVNVRAAPADVRPNVNVRAPQADVQPDAQPDAQPRVSERPVPRPRPNTDDRPMSHTDAPAPANGSPNARPAHAVDPNTRQAPEKRANRATRSAPRTEPEAAPHPQENDRTANDRRRTQSDDPEKAKPEQSDKPPRHG